MRLIVLSAAAVLGLTMPAQAEVLQVFGLQPARNDHLPELRSIVVESFGGSEGAALTIRIEDMLRGISPDGSQFFRVLPAATASGGDALMRGTADADVQFKRYTEKREQCAEKDADGKCLRKEQREVKCSKRRIELDVTLRVVLPDGTLIHSDDTPETIEDSSCEDQDQQPRSRQDVIRSLIARYVDRMRPDFAPRTSDALIRVDENRKGLAKGDADRFKQAVKLTKSDPRAACRVWGELGTANPAHVPTAFNLAVCAEATGPDGAKEAEKRYQAVLNLAGKYPAAATGLARLDDTARARAQLAAHNSP